MTASTLREGDGRGPLAPSFAHAWRAHRVDVCITLVLFVVAAFLTGRVWRFAYDVELYYFDYLHLTLVQKLNLDDIHAPLPLLLFTGLKQLGLGDPVLRLVSLAATGIALALIQLLTFALGGGRSETLHIRLLAIVLFALAPLALSLGDSIRWYPLFALAVSLFLTFYLAGNDPMRLASGALLGVAASIDFLAIFIALPFAIFRYGLERQFRLRFDAAFWALAVFFGSAGLWSAYGVATHAPQRTLGQVQFANSPLHALAQNVLGFFGGNAVGISQAWVVLPAALITLVAAVALIDRRRGGAPVHLFMLMLGGMVIMSLAGFAEPRVFIYLAPIAVALQILFLCRQGATLALVCGVALLAADLGTAASLYRTPSPFKRESSIPQDNVIDFVKSNEKGATLVVTTDAVLADMLAHDPAPQRCSSMFFGSAPCFDAGRHYDAIFLIYGYSSISDPHQNIALLTSSGSAAGVDSDATRMLPEALTAGLQSEGDKASGQAIAARTLANWLKGSSRASIVHFGEDADAALKSRLTGTRLSPYVLNAELFSLGTAGK